MSSDLNNWQQNNQHYLSAALAWLRLRLKRLAQQTAGPVASISPEPVEPQHVSGRKWLFWDKSEPLTNPPRPLLPPAVASEVTEEQLRQATAELEAAVAATPSPAMVVLSQNFGLSRFEGEILLLCAAMELDTGIAALCAGAQSDVQRPYPTFALAMNLFDDPAWNALSPEGPLRHWRLIEINQPGAQPLTTSALRIDERILNFLKGLNYLDDRFSTLFWPLPLVAITELPPSHQLAVQTILDCAHRTRSGCLPVIQLVGSDAASKQVITQQVAATLGLRLYSVPVELMPTQPGDLEMLARLAERETALWPLAIYLDARETGREKTADSFAPLDRFLARTHGVTFLDVLEARRDLSRETITIDVGRPTQAEQEHAWSNALGPESKDLAATLGAQFNLNLTTIQQVAAGALEGSKDDQHDRLWKACLAATRPGLDGLAERIEPKASWDDIVLPEVEMKLLAQIAAQVRNRGKVYGAGGFGATRSRGLSINALFTGESGTGKTMAAEVLANDLKLGLYRIDLSAVINKYIGETEKNLRRLFDAAEQGGAILFFDEADALFGKRSEVKDSHDRYANIEINYLLQRMESYRGLAVLATNRKGDLDPAFLRRVRFVVNFPFPDTSLRAEIWRRIFPSGTPTDDLDMTKLSRLKVAGGNIRNIALNAAFLAAAEGSSVGMLHLQRAARAECAMIEKPLTEAEIGGWI